MAVVGVGSFGRNHARVIHHLQTEAELVAVVDANEERARQIAAEFGGNPAHLIMPIASDM